MLRFAFLFVCCIYFSSTLAQNKLHPLLQEQINNSNELIKVRIEFVQKAHVGAEKLRCKALGLSLHEQRLSVIELLRQTAGHSQEQVLDFLANDPEILNIRSLWIVNVVFCEMPPYLIPSLNNFSQIDRVYLENNRFEFGSKVEIIANNVAKSIGGTEPGIEACNVRPLWELGYTGRGRKVFVYDTGVWPTHPSIRERFMGNFDFLEHAWNGYYHFEPNGERNSHGTHVLGTMLGLEQDTADTVGIAMNSYWIANDHVGPTIAVMPDLPYLMQVYEWALNPDGDFTTTHDIPDVINNSFRWYDGADMEQCEGIVRDLMIAIEAAGIANVYSGGNAGPNNTTISAPQRIAVSEVNTFSVGSINGNVSFPHPLSSFSSLGPKQCAGVQDALAIHPEVVAPGQNVRSAYGQSGYSLLSGTSMASPHVSGVVLLLKEAFPYLTGEDILWALYLTAIDLGPEGEDNQFGRGMIDAFAAFQYLAVNNIPIDPNEVPYDLAVTAIQGIEMNGVYCSYTFSPSIEVQNKGTSTVNSFEINYNWRNGQGGSFIWTGNLLAGQSTVIEMPTLDIETAGFQEYWVEVILINNDENYDLINNRRHVRFNIRPTLTVPFIEEFENGWNDGLWVIENPDESYTWRTTLAPFHHLENKAACIQLANYSPVSNQKDLLESPFFSLPSSSNLVLDFDIAYRKKSNVASHRDTLLVLLKNSCASDFDTLAILAGDDLASVGAFAFNFVPTTSVDWKKMEFNLNNYANQDIQIVFQTINRAGNHLYIDHFRIYESGNEPLSVVNFLAPEISLYPNPTKNKFVYEIKNNYFYAPQKLLITNAMGQVLNVMETTGQKTTVDMSGFVPGVYFISSIFDGLVYTNKLIKEY